MRQHRASQENIKERKNIVTDTAFESCNDLLETYLDEYNKISALMKKKGWRRNTFALDDYDYSPWFEESDDLDWIAW